MGNFKEHLLFGAIIYLLVLYLTPIDRILNNLELLSALIVTLIGSVMPDIDHKNSYVYRATRATLSTGTGIIVFTLSPFEIYESFGLSIVVFTLIYSLVTIPKIKHRGFTHTITFMLIVTAISTSLTNLTIQSPLVGLSLGIGVFSHLLLDREFKFTP